MKSDRYLKINFESKEYYSQYWGNDIKIYILKDVTSSHHKRVRAYRLWLTYTQVNLYQLYKGKISKFGFLSPKINLC